MRYFGDSGNNLFDYCDLVKILEDIDSKNQGTLNYSDFCKWMGGAIHQSQGFYFRHDSAVNPPFEVSLARMQDTEQAVLKTKKKPTIEQIMKQLANKIEF